MTEPYYVNVSSISEFMQCRYRWLSKWVLNRVPRDEAPALGGGKLLHLIFEDYLTGKYTMEQSVEHHCQKYREEMSGLTDAREIDNGEKAIKIIDDLKEALPLWKDKYHFTEPVLEVEEPFEIEFPELPGVIFQGRPDRVGICSGMVWHVQNRGLAAGVNFATYIALAKRHYHEHLYAEALSRKYAYRELKYGGTMFNLVRKLKYRTGVTKKKPLGKTKTAKDMFFQHPMSINMNSEQHRDVMEAMFEHVRDMQATKRRYINSKCTWMPAPNEKLNGGPYGNATDPYYRLLVGEITLADDKVFKDRESTYAPLDIATE